MKDLFEDIATFDHLVQVIRRRYGMWVGEDLSQLRGFLMGFCSARPSVDHSRILEFEEFVLKELRAGGENVKTWTAAVRSRAKHPSFEIPLFFEWYEQFCGRQSQEVARFLLSEAERAQFLERDLLGFRWHGFPAPHSLSLWSSEYWGAIVRVEDVDGHKMHEVTVASIERGRDLIDRYRGVSR